MSGNGARQSATSHSCSSTTRSIRTTRCGENLEFPLKSRHRRLGAEEVAARVARAAQTLRIEHLLERKTDRLSGGEMQRVSIGRAIVRQPRVFLMDEPLSNLDAKLREILRAELKDLQMKLRATFLYVTHDQVEAMSMGDRIGVLNRGRLVQIGTPHEIYNSPRDTFVATFVGSPAMNLLSGVLGDGKVTVVPGKLEIALPADVASRLPPGLDRLTLGVRAEDIVVGPGGGLEGRVYGVENHGVEKIVTLKVDEHSLKATVPAHMAIEVDSAIAFAIDPGKLKFFATQTGVNLVSVKEESKPWLKSCSGMSRCSTAPVRRRSRARCWWRATASRPLPRRARRLPPREPMWWTAAAPR